VDEVLFRQPAPIDLSVIIVSWNAKDCLIGCLRSLLPELSFCRSEIIVVDNASTDGTAREIAEHFPQTIIIQNEHNIGFARANNLAIARAQGKWLCLMNPDVLILKGCIQNLCNYLAEHQEVGIAGPKVLNSDGHAQRSAMGFPSIWNSLCRALALDSLFPKIAFLNGFLMRHFQFDRIASVDVLNGCFWIVARNALEQVGVLDERFFMYAEDIDWCRRFHQKGYKVIFLPTAEIIHYGGKSSSQDPLRFYVEKQRANLQYLRKYHSAPVYWIFCFFIILHHLIRILANFCFCFSQMPKKNTARVKLHRSAACLRLMLSQAITLEHSAAAYDYDKG
jgi:GT2 family glycosyltransferase